MGDRVDLHDEYVRQQLDGMVCFDCGEPTGWCRCDDPNREDG